MQRHAVPPPHRRSGAAHNCQGQRFLAKCAVKKAPPTSNHRLQCATRIHEATRRLRQELCTFLHLSMAPRKNPAWNQILHKVDCWKQSGDLNMSAKHAVAKRRIWQTIQCKWSSCLDAESGCIALMRRWQLCKPARKPWPALRRHFSSSDRNRC